MYTRSAGRLNRFHSKIEPIFSRGEEGVDTERPRIHRNRRINQAIEMKARYQDTH